MLKHIVEHHKGEEESKIEFRMKILKTHTSAFERQVYEGIRIQEERRKHHLLNSKSEFNRCALPRLEVRLGEKEKTKLEKERIEEERRESELEKEIRRIGRNRKYSKGNKGTGVKGETKQLKGVKDQVRGKGSSKRTRESDNKVTNLDVEYKNVENENVDNVTTDKNITVDFITEKSRKYRDIDSNKAEDRGKNPVRKESIPDQERKKGGRDREVNKELEYNVIMAERIVKELESKGCEVYLDGEGKEK